METSGLCWKPQFLKKAPLIWALQNMLKIRRVFFSREVIYTLKKKKKDCTHMLTIIFIITFSLL